MKSVTLFCDGASRGNPGPSSYGYVIYEGLEIIAEQGKVIPATTNNVAEYEGVIQGLSRCRDLAATVVHLKSDSQLLVRQLRGEYKVKAPHLQPLVKKASELIKGFERVEITHIPREENKKADKLANLALDGLL